MNKKMDVLTHFLNSIDYIDERLTEKVELEDIAAAACMSLSGYYVLFKSLTERTLKSYIRQRRLTMAGYDLIHTLDSVLSIAVKYQYDSYEAFSRAFKVQYSISPKAYREQNIFVEIFPKIKVIVTEYQGGQSMVRYEMNKEQIVQTIEASKKGYLLDIDIDRFMSVNENYGRDGGDAVLVEVSKRIREALKKLKINREVIRFGGDEFIIVLGDEAINVEAIANEILELFEKPITYRDQEIKITVCVGITAIEQQGSADLLIQKVGDSMLKAKESGRNQYYKEE